MKSCINCMEILKFRFAGSIKANYLFCFYCKSCNEKYIFKYKEIFNLVALLFGITTIVEFKGMYNFAMPLKLIIALIIMAISITVFDILIPAVFPLSFYKKFNE